MTRPVSSYLYGVGITALLLGLGGCSGSAGYTQSAEELTPRIDIISGDNQSTAVNTAYGTPMKVRFHKNGMALGGHTITFLAPATGASGAFPDGTGTNTAVTDSGGYATAPVFTANGTPGPVDILAWNTNYRANFHLTNQ